MIGKAEESWLRTPTSNTRRRKGWRARLCARRGLVRRPLHRISKPQIGRSQMSTKQLRQVVKINYVILRQSELASTLVVQKHKQPLIELAEKIQNFVLCVNIAKNKG